MARKTLKDLYALRGQKKLIALTAYHALTASIADEIADIILVGDSLGMVLYGFQTTQAVTLEMMLLHGKAVVDSTQKSFVVVDMPFGSYEQSKEQAFENAACLMKETGCQAVKCEGGEVMAETIEFLSKRGVPVVAHIGLTPQAVHKFGGFHKQATTEKSAQQALRDARAVIDAGAVALVLEHMDENAAKEISTKCPIPTIGIGAGAWCDGRIAVLEDVIGLTPRQPPFTKAKLQGKDLIEKALKDYAADVYSEQETYETLTRYREDLRNPFTAILP